MSERFKDHPNLTVYGLSKGGISLDGTRSIIDYPLVLARQHGNTIKITSSPRTAESYFIRKEDISAQNYYQGADGARIPFPFGTISTRRKDGEVENVVFDLGPRFYNESTMETFNSILDKNTEEEALNHTFDLLNMVTCTVSEQDGVEFHSIGSEVMFANISPQGYLAINNEWEQVDSTFQGVCEYSFSDGGEQSPFFELSIGSVKQTTLSGSVKNECLIIAGLTYPSLDANSIHASLVDLFKQERATEEEMREVIDPYIRLVEVNQS